jgi:hypothetical protein
MIGTVRKFDPRDPVADSYRVSSRWISTIDEIQMCCCVIFDEVYSVSFEFGAPKHLPQRHGDVERELH